MMNSTKLLGLCDLIGEVNDMPLVRNEPYLAYKLNGTTRQTNLNDRVDTPNSGLNSLVERQTNSHQQVGAKQPLAHSKAQPNPPASPLPSVAVAGGGKQ